VTMPSRKVYVPSFPCEVKRTSGASRERAGEDPFLPALAK
jgi:hypothetical protein